MTNCRYVRVISPDIPSKTVASLHTVGQGCRVPLLVNWELKLKIGHVMKALRNRGCPHTQRPYVAKKKIYSIYIYIYIYIASVAFSNGDLEKTGPPWLEHIFAVPTCDRIPYVLQDILAVLGHSFEGSQHGLNMAPTTNNNAPSFSTFPCEA